jgi:hypothetical protein
MLVSGCENRGTNIPDRPALDKGGPWTVANHVFSPQLRFQFQNDLELLNMWVYIPQVAADPPLGLSRPVPLLILLAPQFEDQFFYANHGLETLLKEMIADGTIQPMIVACVSNNNAFGGYFYAGGKNFENLPHPQSGAYDHIVSTLDDTLGLIPFLRRFLHVIPARQKTGIGGIEMGAYGAFRAALIHDTVFNSISVTDGPLDFDGGPGFGNGLMDLFDDALLEQGLLGGNIKIFDSSSAWPLSNLFIGGAYAFSPHDTVIYHRVIRPIGPGGVEQDPYPAVDSTLKIDNPADTLTLISGYFSPGTPYRFDFHLPFDANGTVFSPIWDNFWMTEDLENLLDSAANKLNGVDIWVASTSEAKYNYYQQTQSWINTLTSAPYNYPVTEYNYQGETGQPADSYQYTYDLLREMLIFHSNSFGN